MITLKLCALMKVNLLKINIFVHSFITLRSFYSKKIKMSVIQLQFKQGIVYLSSFNYDYQTWLKLLFSKTVEISPSKFLII